jgi:uncharacterized protein DUF4386
VGVNGLLLGYLMYRSGLVPRQIAMLGLIGGPLIFASSIAVLFGAYEQDGAHFLLSFPEIAFEASITIYLIVKGSSRPRSSTTPGTPELARAPGARPWLRRNCLEGRPRPVPAGTAASTASCAGCSIPTAAAAFRPSARA